LGYGIFLQYSEKYSVLNKSVSTNRIHRCQKIPKYIYVELWMETLPLDHKFGHGISRLIRRVIYSAGEPRARIFKQYKSILLRGIQLILVQCVLQCNTLELFNGVNFQLLVYVIFLQNYSLYIVLVHFGSLRLRKFSVHEEMFWRENLGNPVDC
jgi:hypothetical protein